MSPARASLDRASFQCLKRTSLLPSPTSYSTSLSFSPLKSVGRIHSTQIHAVSARSLTSSSQTFKAFSFRVANPVKVVSRAMSFSNTSTGDAPADPYTAKAKDEVPLKEKISDFTNFISSCKFAMMTTRIGETGQMTSRAMALAATVRIPFLKLPNPQSSPP